MSNPTIPTSNGAANLPPCPPWCDPQSCEVTEVDVNHLGTTVTVDTVDAEYGITLVRADHLARPDEWNRPPSVQLYVQSKACAAPGDPTGVRAEAMHACADVGVDELARLIAALAAQLALAGGAS